MRGSFVCDGWDSLHVAQHRTTLTSSECIPGQYMTSLAVFTMYSVRMLEAWTLVTTSRLIEVGMIIHISLNIIPLLAISSSCTTSMVEEQEESSSCHLASLYRLHSWEFAV